MFKIKITQVSIDREEEVIINCHEINDEVLELVGKLKKADSVLLAVKDNQVYRLSVNNIYYIESIDNKTFVYTKDDVYESKQRLYEIENQFINTKLFRCSKSMILNLGKILSVSPSVNGRFEAKLSNNENVIISRQYVPNLKKRLGM